MSELIEFDDLAQIETLLRAGIELKFELSDDSDLLNGSPIYASALNHLRDGLIEALRESFMLGRAQTQADWYRLSRHPHRLALIAGRAVSHPRWRELSRIDMRQWIETLAAPLIVDDKTFESVKMEADKIGGGPGLG
jgi:hypothetical protein